MKIAKRLLEELEDWVSGILIVSGLMVMFYGVVLRYGLSLPTTWQDEISRTLLVWGILIGIAATLRDNNHIRVNILYNIFPNNFKKVIDIFANLVILGFSLFMLFSGIELVSQKLETGQESLNGYPLWIIYLILPIFASLLTVRTIEKFVYIFKGEPEDTSEDLQHKL